ncbi:tRNA threonylcarbamoyladenosine biosynthesis protein TsaB [Clostridiales Family XIII bacterium PM5-7]
MYILAIETTGPVGSVAIIDQHQNMVMETSQEEMNHLKDLIPMASRLTEKLGITPKDFTAVAASVGPGSFTGIRIGVSTARALAQSLNIPAIAVPTLELFKLFCDGSSLVVPIFNARRGQVYGAVFDADGNDLLAPGPYMLDDVLAIKAVKDGCFYGDGVDAYSQQIEGFATAPKSKRYQTAEMVAKVAFKLYQEGKTVSYNKLLPEYMRATEAEQKLKDGSLARERAAKLERWKSK